MYQQMMCPAYLCLFICACYYVSNSSQCRCLKTANKKRQQLHIYAMLIRPVLSVVSYFNIDFT